MTDRQTLYTYRMSQADATLNDARIMRDQGGTPRSVVNRAYYAIFYSVLGLFLKTGIPLHSSKHSGVIGAFDKEFILPGKVDKKYSQIFHTLFEDRQEFDYKDQLDVDNDDGNLAIEKATDFISSIKQYLKNNPNL